MTDPASIWRNAYRHPEQWDQDFSDMTMPDMLAETVARCGQAPFLDFMGRRFSYVQVADVAQRVSAGLRDMGYGAGDRISLYLPNVPHYVAAYFGIMGLGAIAVNFSPLYSVDELSAQVEDSGTHAMFTLSAAALLPTALKLLAEGKLERLIVGSVAGVLPPLKSLLYRMFKQKEVSPLPKDQRVTRFSTLIARAAQPALASIQPGDVALLQYTGGTTGTPKGAKLTHQNLTAVARQIVALDPHRDAEDRIVGVLPFFHVFANSCVLNRTVRMGGMIAMLPRFEAKAALQTITRVKATALPGVPTMYQALLDHPDTAKTDFSSLRACISGGAPLAQSVKVEFERVTGAKLVEGYGLTESSGVVSCNPYEGENKPGTIGQPLPGTLIRLLDRDDPTRDAPVGVPGEIAIKGPQIMQGYWQRPEADREVFIDGWLRTGDVGEIDSDGYIRIVDRLKDMISVGGFKVFPSVVEAQLYSHPAIREALVIGVPDAYAGERPKAFVTLRPGATVDGLALVEWLNPKLGKHERVIGVEIRDTLPKTLVGKLSRKELVAEERAKQS